MARPAPKRDGEEHDRRRDRHRGDGVAAQPADPERVDELIGGLQHVRERDRHRERQQRAKDRSLEPLIRRGRFRRRGHRAET